MKAPILETIYVKKVFEENPDLSWLNQDYFADHYTGKEAYMNVSQELNEKYKAEDAERLRRFEAGNWYSLGIVATADIKLRYKGIVFVHEMQESIWGICSDDQEGIDRNIQEQVDIIKHQASLKGIAISPNVQVIIKEIEQ